MLFAGFQVPKMTKKTHTHNTWEVLVGGYKCALLLLGFWFALLFGSHRTLVPQSEVGQVVKFVINLCLRHAETSTAEVEKKSIAPAPCGTFVFVLFLSHPISTHPITSSNLSCYMSFEHMRHMEVMVTIPRADFFLRECRLMLLQRCSTKPLWLISSQLISLLYS